MRPCKGKGWLEKKRSQHGEDVKRGRRRTRLKYEEKDGSGGAMAGLSLHVKRLA